MIAFFDFLFPIFTALPKRHFRWVGLHVAGDVSSLPLSHSIHLNSFRVAYWWDWKTDKQAMHQIIRFGRQSLYIERTTADSKTKQQ